MTKPKTTKSDLIAVLVEQKRGTHAALQRLTLAGLQAMVDEQPVSTEVVIGSDNNVSEKDSKNVTKSVMVAAESLTTGLLVVGTRKRIPTRKIGRVAVGRKHVTIWDEAGKDFGYWALGAKVEVVSP